MEMLKISQSSIRCILLTAFCVEEWTAFFNVHTIRKIKKTVFKDSQEKLGNFKKVRKSQQIFSHADEFFDA